MKRERKREQTCGVVRAGSHSYPRLNQNEHFASAGNCQCETLYE